MTSFEQIDTNTETAILLIEAFSLCSYPLFIESWPWSLNLYPGTISDLVSTWTQPWLNASCKTMLVNRVRFTACDTRCGRHPELCYSPPPSVNAAQGKQTDANLDGSPLMTAQIDPDRFIQIRAASKATTISAVKKWNDRNMLLTGIPLAKSADNPWQRFPETITADTVVQRAGRHRDDSRTVSECPTASRHKSHCLHLPRWSEPLPLIDRSLSQRWSRSPGRTASFIDFVLGARRDFACARGVVSCCRNALRATTSG